MYVAPWERTCYIYALCVAVTYEFDFFSFNYFVLLFFLWWRHEVEQEVNCT